MSGLRDYSGIWEDWFSVVADSVRCFPSGRHPRLPGWNWDDKTLFHLGLQPQSAGVPGEKRTEMTLTPLDSASLLDDLHELRRLLDMCIDSLSDPNFTWRPCGPMDYDLILGGKFGIDFLRLENEKKGNW